MKKLSNTEAELRKSVACKKGVIPEKIYCNTWIYLGNVWKGKDCFTKKTEKKKKNYNNINTFQILKR